MTSTPAQFAAKMARTADGIKNAQRDGVNEAARVFQGALRANAAAVTGGDLRLSGMPRAVLGSRLLTAKTDTNPTAEVRGFPPGVWKIVEEGAKPHLVGGKAANASDLKTRQAIRVGKTGRRLSQRRKVMASQKKGFGPVTGPFVGGGSPGKHPFETTRRVMQPKMAAIVNREVTAAMAKSFR